MKMRSLVPLFVLACAVAAPTMAASPPRPPLKQNGGTWPSGHVQGIAVDEKNGHVYYSFTNLLAKYDFSGKLIGTLKGWKGHLGDLDFNPDDGRVYGSLEYGKELAFHIAVIDVARIDRVGIDAMRSDILKTVHLAEVARDYAADMDGDGRLDAGGAASRDHRYGCSGIDGVGFGPAFGRSDGPRLLTVAYGVYGNVDRSDNDHQMLLQYDVGDWDAYARPLDEADLNYRGPAAAAGKYFLRTGNTTYGVQNLSYDAASQRWFLGVYRGKKAAFPNYLLFAVDARTPPVAGDLVGVPGPGGKGWERGLLLTLADDGLRDAATGIRGWEQKADVGFQPLGDGRFYLATNSAGTNPGGERWQSADIALVRWSGDPQAPFAPVTE